MISEKQLLKRARKFDIIALEEIYDRYNTKIYQYALRLLGDEQQAEDCVAETFSRFLNALKRGLGPKSYLQAYLYRIAHNWITDQYRQKARVPFDLEENNLNIESDQQVGSDDVLLREQVIRALKQLTPDQRQVIVLKYLEGLSNSEVAKTIEKSIGAVKSLQHRGLNALRRLLLESDE